MVNPQLPGLSSTPKPSLFPHKDTGLQTLKTRLREQTSNVIGRLKLVEERMSVLRNHLNVIDNSLIEKHKATIAELRSVEDDVRTLRADADEVKDLTGRLLKRLEEFASKEEIKVLERYVELWRPMDFVTRTEVESIVKNILKDKLIKGEGKLK